MGHLTKSSEDGSAESCADRGDPTQEISEGNQLATRLESILVIFGQRKWLLSFLVLRICPRVSLK